MKKSKLAANIDNCKYDVVREQVLKYGMEIVQEDSPWNLFWIDTGVSFERILTM
jgi:hypothetical protein